MAASTKLSALPILVGIGGLMMSTAIKADEYEDAVKAKIERKLNDKLCQYYSDETSSGTFGKKGRETWVHDIRTGKATYQITKQGSGLNTKYVATICLPVSGRYERKTFKGIGSEYNREEWQVHFKYCCTYSMGFGSNSITDERIKDSETAADHDAVQKAKQQLVKDVINKLKED